MSQMVRGGNFRLAFVGNRLNKEFGLNIVCNKTQLDELHFKVSRAIGRYLQEIRRPTVKQVKARLASVRRATELLEEILNLERGGHYGPCHSNDTGQTELAAITRQIEYWQSGNPRLNFFSPVEIVRKALTLTSEPIPPNQKLQHRLREIKAVRPHANLTFLDRCIAPQPAGPVHAGLTTIEPVPRGPLQNHFERGFLLVWTLKHIREVYNAEVWGGAGSTLIHYGESRLGLGDYKEYLNAILDSGR